ncbi:MAG TPA: HIT family protein [Methanosarcina sp.]|nr:HIT family protein [Methanosarcina sp.]
MEDCVFCKIIAERVPSYKVYEDDAVFAFLDVSPASEGHTLVAPKKHFNRFTDMDKESVASLFEAARKITAAAEKTFSAGGSNIGINDGKVAGQEIPHVHVHVIPRRKGDGGRGIKSIVWTEPDTANLKEVAEKIRRAL